MVKSNFAKFDTANEFWGSIPQLEHENYRAGFPPEGNRMLATNTGVGLNPCVIVGVANLRHGGKSIFQPPYLSFAVGEMR